MVRFFETKLFRHFLPFVILVVGGSFYVREFTAVRYKYRKVQSYDIRHQLEKEGIEMNEPTTLELEYEKMKELNIDDWENVRIPRPWEEAESVKN